MIGTYKTCPQCKSLISFDFGRIGRSIFLGYTCLECTFYEQTTPLMSVQEARKQWALLQLSLPAPEPNDLHTDGFDYN